MGFSLVVGQVSIFMNAVIIHFVMETYVEVMEKRDDEEGSHRRHNYVC